MENIARIKNLVQLQKLFNREREIKNLYAEEEKKMEKVKQENDILQTSENEIKTNINEMEKKINEELGKRDEINKRINSLEEGKEKIKIARQIKSWEKEMEKQQQELSLIQAQIDYDTAKQLEMKNELEKITAKINENNEKVTELEAHINSIKKQYKKELDKTLKDQNKLRAEFDLQFIEYYESLMKKTNGSAIVEVEQDACAGCYTVLPTNLQGEIGEELKIENIDLYQCPHCFRYLYYKSWIEK
jgi:hypothetical protein